MKAEVKWHHSQFLYLIITLMAYFIGVSLVNGQDIDSVLLSIIFTTFIMICVFSMNRNPIMITLTLILGVMTLAGHWMIVFSVHDKSLEYFFYFSNIAFLLINTFSIIYTVAKHKRITSDTLFGAVIGYFLIGLIWSAIDILISMQNPEAFSKGLFTHSFHENAQHFFYFSFTTMTTLGYGDYLPLSNLARTCSWLEALTGQVYLTVWISQLVGLKIAQRMQR